MLVFGSVETLWETCIVVDYCHQYSSDHEKPVDKRDVELSVERFGRVHDLNLNTTFSLVIYILIKEKIPVENMKVSAVEPGAAAN